MTKDTVYPAANWKPYLLVEDVDGGLKILSHWDTLSEAVKNLNFNQGRHESNRQIAVFKAVTWREEITEV